MFSTADQYFSQDDLKTFQTTYDLTVQSAVDIGGHVSTNCTVHNITSAGTDDCYIGNVETQYLMGLAQNTMTIYWYVDDTEIDPYVAWITDLSSLENPPSVNTISYGSIEQVYLFLRFVFCVYVFK
jgi:hypothetical protein